MHHNEACQGMPVLTRRAPVLLPRSGVCLASSSMVCSTAAAELSARLIGVLAGPINWPVDVLVLDAKALTWSGLIGSPSPTADVAEWACHRRGASGMLLRQAPAFVGTTLLALFFRGDRNGRPAAALLQPSLWTRTPSVLLLMPACLCPATCKQGCAVM